MCEADDEYRCCDGQCFLIQELESRFRLPRQVDRLIVGFDVDCEDTRHQNDDEYNQEQHLIIHIVEQCECEIRADGRCHYKAQAEVSDAFAPSCMWQCECCDRPHRRRRHTVGKTVEESDDEQHPEVSGKEVQTICNDEHDRSYVHDLPCTHQGQLMAGHYPADQRSDDENPRCKSRVACGDAKFVYRIPADRHHQQEHCQHDKEVEYEYDDEIAGP